MTRLREIFAHKRQEVLQRKAGRPLEAVIADALRAAPALDFVAALRQARRPALIAEVKQASPSRGQLAHTNGRPFDPVLLATQYAANGAAAISVLTDEAYFRGSLAHLQAVRSALRAVPLLRKDFICDAYQIYEARAAGADAILLIATELTEQELREYGALAATLGMAALVEAHTATELQVALGSGAALVGINNRNLHDFTVRLETTLTLGPQAPAHVCLVAESGIFSAADVRRLSAGRGVEAILVGEALVTAADVGAKVRELSGMDARP